MSLISNERPLLQSKESKLQARLWWERNEWICQGVQVVELDRIFRESWKSMEGEICGFSFHEKRRFCGEAISCYSACFPMYLHVHWKHRFDSLCGTLLLGPNFPVVQARLVLREVSAEFDFQGLVTPHSAPKILWKTIYLNRRISVSKKMALVFSQQSPCWCDLGVSMLMNKSCSMDLGLPQWLSLPKQVFGDLEIGVYGTGFFSDGCWWKKSSY